MSLWRLGIARVPRVARVPPDAVPALQQPIRVVLLLQRAQPRVIRCTPEGVCVVWLEDICLVLLHMQSEYIPLSVKKGMESGTDLICARSGRDCAQAVGRRVRTLERRGDLGRGRFILKRGVLSDVERLVSYASQWGGKDAR